MGGRRAGAACRYRLSRVAALRRRSRAWSHRASSEWPGLGSGSQSAEVRHHRRPPAGRMRSLRSPAAGGARLGRRRRKPAGTQRLAHLRQPAPSLHHPIPCPRQDI